jgi:hypothetical protein
MIISASRRTDIPAFYAAWLIKRIRQGECQVVNPYRRDQIKRVSLLPGDVDEIVFWTRHALPLLPFLDELDQRGFRYYFQYTLTDYPRALELKAPSLAAALGSFQALAKKIGKERVIWRYDPIYLSQATTIDFHRRNFQTLARTLRGYSQRCVVSLFDDYAKARSRLSRNPEFTPLVETSDEFRTILDILMPELVEIAADNQFEMVSCAEKVDMLPYGITPGKCVDDNLIRQVFGLSLEYKKDPGQRLACRCLPSQDIGRYDTCPFGCQYCYANRSFEQAARYFKSHNSDQANL